MGVLAAGGIIVDAAKYACGCRERVENLRIAIAARGVECEPPMFWPERRRSLENDPTCGARSFPETVTFRGGK